MTDESAVFLGLVEDGKLKLQNERRFRAHVAGLKGIVELSVRRVRNRRSSRQNRYLWGVVYKHVQADLFAAGLRATISEVHELCMMKFSRRELVNENTGEVYGYIRRTSEMSTVEFNEYYQRIQEWDAEYLGGNIPDPNEQEDEP